MRTPADQIRHALRLHERGIIAPAEMWLQIAKVVEADPAILDQVGESRDALYEVYRDRPWSLRYRDFPEKDTDARRLIESWCLDRPERINS